MKRFLLKQKVAVLLIVISLLSLIVVGFFVFTYINKVLVENKKQEILYGSTEQAHESSLTFKNSQLFAYMVSTQNRVRDVLINSTEDKKAQITNLFSEYTKNNKNYLALYLLDKNGVGFVSTDPRFIGQDYSFRDYFKKAMNGEPVVDVLVGKTSNQFGYYFINPVFGENNQVLGVLILKVDEKDINMPLTSSKISEGNTLMLVDGSGVIVSSTDESRKLRSLGVLSPDETSKIIEGNRFPGNEIIPLQYNLVQEGIRNYEEPVVLNLYDEEDGEHELFSIIKLDDFPFYIVTEIRLDSLSEQVFETVFIIIVIISIVLILISLFLFYFLRIFLKPVDKFVQYFNSISNGNFSKELVIDTKDEFSYLASRVNKMAKDLSELYKNLDEKVKEQTLDIQNKINESNKQNIATLNILEDVEKEKFKAERLASDLEKFKLAVENVSDQIVITDSEGIVIYGNKAMEKITGYKQEEALGKKAGILWKLPMSVEYYENLWDVIKNQKKTFTGEIQNQRKNGEVYTSILSISSVLDKDGKIMYFVAIEKDITSIKEAEDQVRKVLNEMQEQAQSLTIAKAKDDAILAGIGDGIVTTNQDGIITLINQSALNLIGYTIGEVLNQPVINIFRAVDDKGEDIPLSRRPIIQALSTGEKTVIPLGLTYYYIRKDGTKFPAGITVTPFMLNGKIIGTIEVFRDITIEKEIDKTKTEFVSLASHQLRTPLSAIGWYTEMLLSGDAGKISAKQKDYLDEIYRGNKNMVELVGSLLNVSRLELGTFSVDPVMTDITKIVDSVLQELKPEINTRKMNIKVDYEENLSQINIDLNLIRIVYQNLITNALKYTPDGGTIEITIKTDGDNLFSSVKDNGHGIPQNQKDNIFQKLFRADNVKVLDSNGTGLGLYIVRSIIEHSSGGRIWFDSIEEKGTTFFFTIPKSGMKPSKGSAPLK